MEKIFMLIIHSTLLARAITAILEQSLALIARIHSREVAPLAIKSGQNPLFLRLKYTF
jgi:hypothetical protein